MWGSDSRVVKCFSYFVTVREYIQKYGYRLVTTYLIHNTFNDSPRDNVTVTIDRRPCI